MQRYREDFFLKSFHYRVSAISVLNKRRNAITDVTLELIAKIAGPSNINEPRFRVAINISDFFHRQ